MDDSEFMLNMDSNNGKLSRNSSDASGVLHTPLKTGKDIRLLSLRKANVSEKRIDSWTMETFTVRGPSCPPYKALSYTWESPIFTTTEVPYGMNQTIICNGLEVGVGRNLYDALEQLEISKYREHIWIDALCINQSDEEERYAQVLLMGDIYAESAEVIVWLGKDDRFLSDIIWIQNQEELLSRAWQYMKQMDISATQSVLFPINERTAAAQELLMKWQGYWKFFECRRWFTRAWIVQEVILARRIVIWCGQSQLQYTEVDMLLKLLRGSGTLGLLHRYADVSNGEASPNMLFRLGMNRDSCRNGLPDNNSVGTDVIVLQQGVEALKFHAYALTLVNLVRTHRATKIEDKVYCFVGILERFQPNGVPSIIIPNYALTAGEIYSTFTFAMIERLPSLEILSIVEDKRHRRISSLPSWVPDYTYSSETFTGLAVATKNCRYKPVERHSPIPPRMSGSTLILHGFRIDNITATSLPACSTAAVFEWEHPTWFEYLEALVAIADPQHLSPLYTTPAPAILCRTLIAGSLEGSPAPHTMELSFLSWLVYMTGRPGSMEHLTGQPDSAEWRTFQSLLAALAALTNGPLVDTRVPWMTLMGDIVQFVELLMTSAPSDPRRAAAIASYSQGLTAFNMENGMHIEGRKIFRSSNRLLGLGTASVEPGDEIWAIDNAQMVMVLRPCHREDGVQLMQFVGDGYLHGYMRGELFQALGVNTSSGEIHII